jgi:hypothetical protein
MVALRLEPGKRRVAATDRPDDAAAALLHETRPSSPT